LAEQQALLRLFVQRYGEWTEQTFSELDWPDLVTRAHPQCDCLAKSPDGKRIVAIEHTELEVLKGQNADRKRFVEYFQSHEGEFAFIGFTLEVTLPGSELRQDKKIDWQKTSAAVLQFLTGTAESLPFGGSEIAGLPDIPFAFNVYKRATKVPRSLWFKRFDSRDFRDSSLAASFRKAIEDKKNKFDAYDRSICTRILLVENKDVQLTNDGTLYEFYLRATGGVPPAFYDEIWLCWTWPERSGPVHNFVCLEGPTELAERANGMFDVGPHWKQHWLNGIQKMDAAPVQKRNPLWWLEESTTKASLDRIFTEPSAHVD